MNFPLVNILEQPYEAWEYRQLSFGEALACQKETGKPELMQKTNLIARIENHSDAARYMLQRRADNRLEFHIDRNLDSSPSFREIMNLMPRQIPASIEGYKHSYRTCNFQNVSEDIEIYGGNLHEEQILFHGGFCPKGPGELIVTARPFSTSFCPQVALRNAEWMGKAYEVGEVHILVLRIASPSVRAFAFPLEGELGNEKEVLLSAGVKLAILSKTLVRNDYEVCRVDSSLNTLEKNVPAYVIQINVTHGP